MIYSLLFADRSDDGVVTRIDIALIDGQVGVLATPLLALERQLREVDLIQIQNTPLLEPHLLQLL